VVNLIEKFFEDTEKIRLFLVKDTGAGTKDYQEIYFFLGRDSVLCISKQDNRILYNIKYAQLQISITSPNEFTINAGGNILFFCQDNIKNETSFLPSIETDKQPSFVPVNYSDLPESVKYPYKAICDACTNKRCSQYDAINGRNFKFGKGKISEDMLAQYDKYCELKIKKFGCDKTNKSNL